MKVLSGYLLFAILFLTAGCNKNQLFKNKSYKSVVETAFNERKLLAANRSQDLFSVFSTQLSEDQSYALKFLYAFMPLNDLADYNGDFFLSNVKMALKARNETEWGKTIPEDIFLHYVLPCRINNENLDSFRIVYFNEIHERIIGKSLRDAALEINHWCHEKVSYQASDSRTSAPMSTILSARGRCGEESTFTVAALRTAGIPARQVYTPRWAHTDDNHAWVEIWDNGKWFYMGACEPEPVIDRGWFTDPARRAMMIHTKSFGAPSGTENTITKHLLYSQVNSLSKYAVTKTIFVKVLDVNEIPVKNASVDYKLYNYAEFYSIASVPTDSKGISKLETGLGDLLIWATDGNMFNFKKISVSETDTLTLILNETGNKNNYITLDLEVPVVRDPSTGPSEELINVNAIRVEEENQIRQKYIDSWISKKEVLKLAVSLKIDSTRLVKIFNRSMGNYKAISNFLTNCPDSLKYEALILLETLADKDLRDTKSYILADHLNSSYDSISYPGKLGYEIFRNYVLNPRIDNEILSDWRLWLRNNLPREVSESAPKDPEVIIKYLDNVVTLNDSDNYYNTPITPRGVIGLKVSDSQSRAICFVAICRSLGIPSRIDPAINAPQYFVNGTWNDVYFSGQQKPGIGKGYLKITTSDANPIPEYYTHFTIARLINGSYRTLELEYNRKASDFSSELELTPGKYILVTGNRLNSGTILSSITFFGIEVNEHRKIDVKIRKDTASLKIIGKIDLKSIEAMFNNKTVSECVNSIGAVILWIEPEKEPTKHIFNDLPLLRKELDAWGGQFLFIYDPLSPGGKPDPDQLKGLPLKSEFGKDNGFAFLKEYIKDQPVGISLPYILLSDPDGNITFASSGYRIGIGEQILKSIRK